MENHAGVHLDEHQHGGPKPTGTSVTEFCYKSMNLFLEELITLILKKYFFLYMNCLDSKVPQNKSLSNIHDSSLSHHVNAMSHESLDLQAYSITKPRMTLKQKFV